MCFGLYKCLFVLKNNLERKMGRLKHLVSKSKFGRRYIKVLPVKKFEVTGESYVESWLLESYRQRLKDNSVLRRAKRKVRKKLIPALLEALEDYSHDFSVVSKPSDEAEYQDGYGYYVNQYCNGGYSGDEFRGWIYFPMKNGKFLKFHYAC